MEKQLFDDLISACHEAIEHEESHLKLNSNIVTITDDEIDADQLIIRKIEKLSREDKQKVSQYADELLLASSG